MVEDTIKATGEVQIKLYNPDGSVKSEQTIPNLVVTLGKNFIASRMVGTSPAVMSHMAVGAGTTAANAADTALGSQLGIVTLSSGTATGAVATYVASFPAGTGTGAVTEAGVFNASTSGTLLCRTVFSVVNKGSLDAMTITWAITIS
jgi:hypothetical protein